jgi:hypothetical protein
MCRSLRTRFILPATIIILAWACAKISAPSGGVRDRRIPVVVKSVPQPNTKNFRGKRFIVTFNEYVVLDNITEKFMVSPPMKKKPRVFIKGKNVNVEFDDVLKDSTTYTFYFQDAIRDLNEGNILDNYKFVFSTGPVIDSLSVTGNVYNSLNLEVPEKTQVIMYRELEDSAVVKHLPDYISRVSPSGYFRMDNVHPGRYKLYALKDADNSKNYNNTEEEFAFMNSPVEITTEKNFLPEVKDTLAINKEADKDPDKKGMKKTVDKKEEKKAVDKKEVKKAPAKKEVSVVPDTIVVIGEYQLLLFAALKTNHYLTSSDRPLKYQFNYTLSLPPDSMAFEFSIQGSGSDTYFTERSKNNDSLKVWLTDSTLYSKPQISTIVKFPFTDTLGNLAYKVDTILMRFTTPRATRGTKVKKPVFDVENNIIGGSLKPGQQIVLKSETPFRQPDTTRIFLYELLDSGRIRMPYKLIKDSLNACRYLFNASLQQKKKYLFIADSASFSSIYNVYSDSTGIKFSIKEPESYCKLTLNIQKGEGDLIIQLLNNTEKLVSEEHLKKEGKLVFPLLETGIYRVKVIYDLNGDGRWTTGDFATGRQAEPVSYYPGEIELKTGWDLEQDWDVGIKNFKNQKLREKRKTKK